MGADSASLGMIWGEVVNLRDRLCISQSNGMGYEGSRLGPLFLPWP